MSKAPGKNYFLVYVRDLPNAQRSKHFAKHMEKNMPAIQSGRTVAGGAILAKGSTTTDPDVLEKMAGTALFVVADTEEEVWEQLREDPYYVSGEVWDISTLEVTPMLLAAPVPKSE